MLRIPHNAFVFVGDGHKALFLRNEGDAQLLSLKTERVFTDTNPTTHEQGTDRPGRSFSSVGPGRSSVQQTDWHEVEEHRFAHEMAGTLERIVRERGVEALVVVAPPRALADLRKAFHPNVKKKIIAEIDKDLTQSIRSRSIWRPNFLPAKNFETDISVDFVGLILPTSICDAV